MNVFFFFYFYSPDDVQSIISGKLALRYSGSQVQYQLRKIYIFSVIEYSCISRNNHVNVSLNSTKVMLVSTNLCLYGGKISHKKATSLVHKSQNTSTVLQLKMKAYHRLYLQHIIIYQKLCTMCLYPFKLYSHRFGTESQTLGHCKDSDPNC